MEDQVRKLVAVLEESGARWVVVGAHAVGFLTTPRATVDVDFVVEERKLSGVVAALEREIGPLDVEDIGPALRLKGIDVDLIRSTNHPLFAAVLEQAQRIEEWNVPRPEALIALKFMSAVSPWRSRVKRLQDTADLIAVYQASSEGLDRGLMSELAKLAYPGAQRELEALLDKVDRGEPLTI